MSNLDSKMEWLENDVSVLRAKINTLEDVHKNLHKSLKEARAEAFASSSLLYDFVDRLHTLVVFISSNREENIEEFIDKMLEETTKQVGTHKEFTQGYVEFHNMLLQKYNYFKDTDIYKILFETEDKKCEED